MTPFDHIREALARGQSDMLADLAVEQGLVSESKLDDALQVEGPVVDELVRRGLLTREQLDILRALRDDRDRIRLAEVSLRSVHDAGTHRILDRYVLVKPVGQGGLASVWRAWDARVQRWVAVKMPRGPLPEILHRRFEREARAAASLRHPNLVRVHDIGTHENQPFLVMEFIEGRPLEAAGDVRLAATRIRKVARALAEVHRHGIVHRDLKPANILLDSQGEPHIVDFGLAHMDESEQTTLTKAGATLGTPVYMAPEQIRGGGDSVDARADIYSLGAVMYQLLAGHPPHVGRTPDEVYEKVLREDPVPPPDVPVELRSICMKALQKDPARRYSGAAEMADDLDRYFEGIPIQAPTPSPFARLFRSVARRPWIVVAGLVLIAVWFLARASGENADNLRKLQEEFRSNRKAWSQASAFQELLAGSGEAMRRLEDAWRGARPSVPVRKLLETVRKSDDSPLGRAWKSLGEQFAGGEFETACEDSGDNPFPHVIRCFSLLARYDRAMDGPDPEVGTSGTFIRFGRVRETDHQKKLRQDVERELEHLEGAPTDVSVIAVRELAGAVRSWSDGRLEESMNALSRILDHPLFAGTARHIWTLVSLQLGAHEEAADRWTELGERGWSNCFLRAGAVRVFLAIDLTAKGEDGVPMMTAAIRDLDREPTRSPVLHQTRAVAKFHLGQVRTLNRLDPTALFESVVREIESVEGNRRWCALMLYLVARSELDIGRNPLPRLDRAEEHAAELIRESQEPRYNILAADLALLRSKAETARGLSPVKSLRRAVAMYESAVDKGAESFQVYWSLGSAQTSVARSEPDPAAMYRRAIISLDRAHRLQPGHAAVLSARGYARLQMAELDRSDPEAYRKAVGDFDHAVRLHKAAVYFAGRAAARERLAVRLAETGGDAESEFRSAISDLSSAIRDAARDGRYYHQRGMTRAVLGQWLAKQKRDPTPELSEAVADFTEAIRLRKGYWEAHRDLGRVLLILGRKTDGIESLRKSLSINPNQPAVRRLIEGE